MYLYGNKEGRETHEDYVKTYDIPIVIDGNISEEFKLTVKYYDMTLGPRTSSSEVHIFIIRHGKTVHSYSTTYETFKIYPTIAKLINNKEPFIYEKPLLYHITNNSRPEEVVNGILKEQLRYKNKREEMFTL